MADALDSLTISIATRNRPETVEATLRQLLEFGLGNAEMIVCDDGSDPPLACPTLARFARGRLLRNVAPIGQALARNRIAQESSGKFILQLDDDSYPVSGDVGALLKTANLTTNAVALAIPFDEPRRNRYFTHMPSSETALRGFVGCSVLLVKETFLRIGGYADWIGRTVEEDELCLRAYRAGWKVFLSDALRIHHDVSPVTRDLPGITHRSFRNWTLAWLQHAPLGWLLIRLGRLCSAAVVRAARDSTPAALRGFASAINGAPEALWRRAPLSYQDYLAFVRLPHALDFLQSCAERSTGDEDSKS